MMTMTQRRIEVTIAGQKITLATSVEHEPLLRSACQLVDDQIQLAIAGGNRSLERATMMAALKLAGDLITAKETPQEIPQASPTAVPDNSAEISRLINEVNTLEDQVDALLKTLSLPGSPRPIAP
ncbi:Cell division protein ZapA-like [Burkholderiaceae bacterium]|jgi:cell division protein ZapA